MSTDIELKDCPFHEWQDERTILPVQGTVDELGLDLYQGACPCGARGPVCSSHVTAAAAWNRRHPKGSE